jgi:diguanylate cyclase (GGDEF)-like protein
MIKFIDRLSIRQKIFFVVLIFGLTLSFTGAFSSYVFRLNQARANVYESIQANINSSEVLLRHEIHNLKSTLLATGEIFSGKRNFYSAGDDVNSNMPYLKAFMLMISRVNSSIMQFRMIDMEGEEKVRIERFNFGDEPVVVTGERLQNKSLRYYFKEGVKVEVGQVWVSELDSNVEFGSVELPEKNTFRLVTPYMVNGAIKGILVINAFTDHILSHFMDIQNTNIYLADIKGDYLSGSVGYSMEKNGNLFEQFPDLNSVQTFGAYYDGKSLIARKIMLDEGRWFYMAYSIKHSYLWNIHKQQIFVSLILYAASGIIAAIMSYMLSGYSAGFYIRKASEAEAHRKKLESMKSEVGELTKRIHKDALTGIHNRRYYNEFVKNRLGVNIMFSMMVIDIDHFKRVNDDYGHDVGDQVLISLARLLERNIRETDMLVRWGGEEFCIIIFDAQITKVSDFAEKLRRMTEEHDFKLGRKLTCSIGVSGRVGSEQPDEVFKRADKALYQAKETGRNRVVII